MALSALTARARRISLVRSRARRRLAVSMLSMRLRILIIVLTVVTFVGVFIGAFVIGSAYDCESNGDTMQGEC